MTSLRLGRSRGANRVVSTAVPSSVTLAGLCPNPLTNLADWWWLMLADTQVRAIHG